MKTLTNIPRLILRSSLLFVMVVWMAGGVRGQTVVSFTTPGTTTWTVPNSVTSINIEVWGGGGAGGGSYSLWYLFGTAYGRGGGGGGGAYNASTFSVATGQIYTITIGAGGVGGSNADGNPGISSSFSGPAGTVTANGGSGGLRGNLNNGAGGTAGLGGDYNGGAGGTSTGNGAGGGGGAGNGGNGGAGGNAITGAAGAGTIPGGIGGAFRSSDGNGNSGGNPGGGGGGSRSAIFVENTGGTGGAGQVVITYTACPTINATVGENDKANISCYAGNDGSITITASGGTAPYEYSIYNGAAGTYQPSNTFTGLIAGTYHPRVKDANGCESPNCP